ncbi:MULTISPECIES: hypothetical protein [Rhodomicrobium]|uniref:hypothetical protein n=1 Tax=Rhodomicrobium TaxID=1068 RepID=UPI000F73F699|nr:MULTISPECIES: hypothetical protein [Rhodomicrobium]
MSEFDRPHPAAGRAELQRRFILFLVVLFVTAFWAAVVHFGGQAVGVPIPPGWLVGFVGAIVLVLLVGLGMAAMVADGDTQVQDLRQRPHPLPIAITLQPPQTPWRPIEKIVLIPTEQMERPDV